MLTKYCTSCKKLFEQNILIMFEVLCKNNFSLPLYTKLPFACILKAYIVYIHVFAHMLVCICFEIIFYSFSCNILLCYKVHDFQELQWSWNSRRRTRNSSLSGYTAVFPVWAVFHCRKHWLDQTVGTQLKHLPPPCGPDELFGRGLQFGT
jgi:hypothetical protein